MIVGNTVENACYNGIAVGGWANENGGADMAVTGNTVRTYGNCGIWISYAPSTVTVTGNTIDNPGQYRGAVDEPTDIECGGIMVRGNPDTNPAAYTAHTSGLLVSDNLIRSGTRFGIMFSGLDYGVIADNVILDTGTHYFANGTTPVSSTDATNNIGILCDYPATVTSVIVRDNVVIDTRGTPYTNYEFAPAAPIPQNVSVRNTTAVSCGTTRSHPCSWAATR